MIEYHKIQSLWKRDPDNNFKTFLFGQWTLPSFQALSTMRWVGTEKIDGMNIRVSVDAIGGRTDNAQIPGDLIIHLTDIQRRMRDADLAPEIILIGEGYGAGIQKGGGTYRPDKAFVLFDIFMGTNFLEQEAMKTIGERLNIPVAPFLAQMDLEDWVDAIADGEFKQSALHPEAENEGVVLRTPVELYDRYGNRMISKLKFRDFV